jgi:predicted O-methyltransferase YrrM
LSSSGDLSQAAEQHPSFHQIKEAASTSEMRCWLTPKEMAFLFGIGAFLEGDGQLVEVGAFEGASAAFTAAGLKVRGHGTLYSIDPHLGGPPYVGFAPWDFTFEKFSRNIATFGLSSYVRPLVADSVSAAAIWPARQIDSLLIDGDHSYLGALKDFECWVPKLRDNGLIVVDDLDDAVLVELAEFFKDLKSMRSITFEGMIDGFAIFRRVEPDEIKLLDEIRQITAKRGLTRPWDLRYVQTAMPIKEYTPDGLPDDAALRVAYQFGFLSRCEPGDYGITAAATPDDMALVRALVNSRKDGRIVTLDCTKVTAKCRFVIAPVETVKTYTKDLMPGAVVIGRSEISPTHENSIAERHRMIAADLEACGWSGQIHWGFYRPHFLSPEAIAYYIAQNTEVH